MDPIPLPPPPPAPAAPDPTAGQPVVEFVRTQRQTAAYVLLGLSVVFLALTLWSGVKGFRQSSEPVPEKPAATDPFNPDNPDLKVGETTTPKQKDYRVATFGALAGFLITAAVGAWLLAGLPPASEGQQRTQARIAILTGGGLLGLTTILFGLLLFYRWSTSLTAWLSKSEEKEMAWAIGPLVIVALGAGLVLGAVQPARAEERNNTLIRRLVYGANFGLTVLLLFVALVVLNVVFAMKVPNRLDTTESGFYSLSDSTKSFLQQLDQPITAYAILDDRGRREDDIRRLLESAQDASGGKFRMKSISPSVQSTDLRELRAKYPQVELNDTGVLLTAGEDGKRNTFIREDEFFSQDFGEGRGRPKVTFAGEARMLREVAFLGENKQRAVVYFTQSAGELSLGSGENIGPGESAAQLKAYLEKNYLDVKPLSFELGDAKVPDDAAVVVVVEPRGTFSDAAVKALTTYMTAPRADGKKGKLIVMAGVEYGPGGKVARTGLEPLLEQFNIRLMDRLVLSEDTREFDPDQTAVMFARAAVQARNPVAVTLGEKVVFLGAGWRAVTPIPPNPQMPGGPSVRAVPLLLTMPGRMNWLEEERPDNMNLIIQQLNASRPVRVAKQLTDGPRPVGAVASEGDTGRVAVIGNGRWVADAVVRQGQNANAPITFDLVGGLIDWLRDRPVVGQGIEAKKYAEYTYPATTDETRVLWVPLGLTLLTVVGLGAGVWVIRRK